MDPWVVLKKLYLDEKCLKQLPPKLSGPSSGYGSGIGSGSGTGTMNSVMSLEHAKKVYGSTGGFGIMPPPSNPYLTNSYKNYDIANGHNQPLPVPVQLPMQMPIVYPPVYPPVPPYSQKQSTVTSYGTPSTYNTTSGVKTRYLDGQAWYNQTASRAVNQAIGRVIRHKKDWGAIFLLDDRFQHEKQVNQLSSWVRPRLKKYPKFPTALVDFRRFLSSAMSDPELKIPVPAAVIIDSRPPGYVQAIAAIAAATASASVIAMNSNGDNTVTRKISIKESDLNLTSNLDKENQDTVNADGDGNGDLNGVSFINPALLMTQVSDPAYSQMTSSFSRSQNTGRHQPYSSVSMKSFGLNKSSSASHNDSNSNGDTSTSNSSSSSNGGYGNSNGNSNTVNTVNNVKGTSTLTGYLTMGMMSAKATVTPSSARPNHPVTSGIPGIPNQSSTRYTTEAAIQRTSASQGNLKFTQDSHQIPHTASANERNNNVSDITHSSQTSQFSQKSTQHTRRIDTHVESDSTKRKMLMTSFSQMPQGDSNIENKNVLSRGKGQDNIVGGSQIEQVKGSYLTNNRSSSSSSSTATKASTGTTANSSTNSSTSSSSSVVPSKSRPVVMTSDPKSILGYNYTATLSQIDQGCTDQASQPSKRAKMMLQAALTSTTGDKVIKKDVNGIFGKSSSHGIREQIARNTEYDKTSEKSKVSLIVKKCVCLVCNSIAAEPCAARCGHICCEPCWQQWLGRKQTCPYCRAPTTMQQIKKITIVKS